MIAPRGRIGSAARPHPRSSKCIEARRRQRFTDQQIAKETGVSPATVSRVPRRLRLSRMRGPAEPIHRYERDRPGELIHLDTKKLGRFDRVGHPTARPVPHPNKAVHARATFGRWNRVAETIERRILELVLEQAAWGHTRIANELAKQGIRVRPPACAAYSRLELNTMTKRAEF